MDGMKVRFEIKDMTLKISNVTPREAEDSYVLLRASDDKDYEIVIVFSHEQADFLANELYEANRRRREHSTSTVTPAQGDFSNSEQFHEIFKEMQ